MARDDVEVHPVPHKTRGYVLHLFHEGRYIGEYEDSRAGDEDREAKIQEAIGASELLLNACSQSSTCMIAVRWNSKMKGKDREKAKEIREYGLCQKNSGKTSPVQLYWHSFDLAVTRSSGRRAPQKKGTDKVTREAYSHEVISFGFWPGDRNVRTASFYSYTAPEPEGLTGQPLRPEAAFWAPEGGTALLMYDDMREADSPKDALLDFLESAYQAGAQSAGWDIEELRAGPAV